MSDNLIPVKYVRNADERATTALRFNNDDREDIEIGGTGAVTELEFNQLQSYGVVLDVIRDKKEAQEILDASRYAADPNATDPLDTADNRELRSIADDEGVDISGLRKNEDIATAIRDHRSAQLEGEGEDSLPATATRTGGPAITGGGAGGGGGAAGPGGAPPAGPAGTGGGTA